MIIKLPNPGDLYSVGYNDNCVCISIDKKAKIIKWYDGQRERFFEQGFKNYRKFIR